ncbi:MAG: FecR domain-containing protein [Verrucomicrobiota bacterium]
MKKLSMTNLNIGSILTLAIATFFQEPLSAAFLKEAQVTRVVNKVDLIDGAQQRRDAEINDVMRDDMILATGKKSRAELKFSDNTLARIGSNSYFTFTEGTRNMELGKGTMLLKVPKGAGGAKISTQSVTAAITGTTVMLEANPGGEVTLKSGKPLPATPEADEDLRRQGLGVYVDNTVYRPGTQPQVASSRPAVQTSSSAIAQDSTQWAPAANTSATPGSVRVAGVNGNVRIMRPGQTQSVPLTPGEQVPVGSFLFTQRDSTATLSPVPGIATKITPGSTLRVKELDITPGARPKVSYELKKGSVLSALGTFDGKQVDYKITTPQGIVAARGTVIGTTTQGGQTGVFGGHGNITFNVNGRQENVNPGQFKTFVGQGSNVQIGSELPSNSPAFQQMMQQTLQLVQEAANRGLVRPGLPNDVRSALQNAGIQVPQQPQGQQTQGEDNSNPPATATAQNENEQPSSSNNRRRNRGTNNQQVAGNTPQGPGNGGFQIQGGNKKGFSKLIVLEGTMRVYLNDRLGESMLIKPGQMIILNPNANRLPQPVDVNTKRLVNTSNLVNGFTEEDSNNQQTGPNNNIQVTRDDAGNTILTDPKIVETIEEQDRKIQNGELSPTGLATVGNRLVPEGSLDPKRKIDFRNNVQNAGGPNFFQPPKIAQGTFTIGANTRIQGAPPQLDTNGQSIQGSILRGGGNQPLADFAFFNGVQPIDQIVSDGQGGPASPSETDVSIFKFETLNLVGNPEVTQGSINTPFGSAQPETLALIGFNDVNVSGFYGANSGFGLPEGVFIVSENGGINIMNAQFGGLDNELIFYARNGDIDLMNADFGTGPLNRINNLNLVASGDLIMDANSDIFAQRLSIFSGSGNPLTLNGSINANELAINSQGQIDLTGLTGLNTRELRLASMVNPILPIGLGSATSFEFAFANTMGGGNFNLNATNFDQTTPELQFNFSGTDVTLTSNFAQVPVIPNSFLQISTDGIFDTMGNIISSTAAGGRSEIRISGNQTNIDNAVTAFGNDDSFVSINAAGGNVNIDDGATINSSSAGQSGFITISSGSDINLGTAFGTGANVVANGLNNTQVTLSSGNDININGVSGVVSSGTTGTNMGGLSISAPGTVTFDASASAIAQGDNMADINITTRTLDMNPGSVLNTTSDSEANIQVNSNSGIIIDGGTIQSNTLIDGPARVSLQNGGSGDITIKDGSSVASLSLGNTTTNFTTTNISNNSGQVIIGNPGGAGATVTASDSGLNTSETPTVFVNATQGIQINDSSQLQAILQSAAAGGGVVQVVNSGTGDIIMEDGSSISADTGSTDGQILVRNDNGDITIGNTTSLMADQIKVGAIGNSGVLTIGNTVMTADSLIQLYGGTGAAGKVEFVGNTTLAGNSLKQIAANTVEIANGVTVNVGGPAAAQVFTNIPNYTGSGGNGSTTGTFTGQGATTNPLSAAPTF